MLKEYQNLIRAIVWRTAGAVLSKDDINDVVQDVNLRILDPARRPDHDPARGEVSAWIGSMAKSMSIDALRRHGRMVPSSDLLDQEDGEPRAWDVTDTAEDTLSMLLRAEQRAALETAIRTLPPDDQHFLIICMRSDYDNEAYALTLGVTAVALRVRKMRLAERLRAIVLAAKE